jgi:hypothetical protein
MPEVVIFENIDSVFALQEKYILGNLWELLKTSGKKLFITGSPSSRRSLSSFFANKSMWAGRPRSG